MKEKIDYRRFSVRYAPDPRGGGYLPATLMPRDGKAEFPANLYDIREIESGEAFVLMAEARLGLR